MNNETGFSIKIITVWHLLSYPLHRYLFRLFFSYLKIDQVSNQRRLKRSSLLSHSKNPFSAGTWNSTTRNWWETTSIRSDVSSSSGFPSQKTVQSRSRRQKYQENEPDFLNIFIDHSLVRHVIVITWKKIKFQNSNWCACSMKSCGYKRLLASKILILS
jgi:hypothetical protein